jgi:hypothetical protein
MITASLTYVALELGAFPFVAGSMDMVFQGLSRDLSAKKRAIANAESSTLVLGGWMVSCADLA